ncbi:MAG: hypothetical protein ACI9MR_001368 [Myxococcota bacterium]|jgi:hypothetical protein
MGAINPNYAQKPAPAIRGSCRRLTPPGFAVPRSSAGRCLRRTFVRPTDRGRKSTHAFRDIERLGAACSRADMRTHHHTSRSDGLVQRPVTLLMPHWPTPIPPPNHPQKASLFLEASGTSRGSDPSGPLCSKLVQALPDWGDAEARNGLRPDGVCRRLAGKEPYLGRCGRSHARWHRTCRVSVFRTAFVSVTGFT